MSLRWDLLRLALTIFSDCGTFFSRFNWKSTQTHLRVRYLGLTPALSTFK